MPATQTSPRLGRRAIEARAAVIGRIKDDHTSFKDALRRFGKLDLDADRHDAERLVDRFVADLRFHSHFEQAHLYPAVQASCDDRHLTDTAEIEHQSMAALLDQLEQSRHAGDDRLAALFEVLGAQLLRHVKYEQARLLPLLRKAPVDWPALANLIEQREQPVEPTVRALLQASPGDVINPPADHPVDDHIEPPTVLATPDTPAERRAAARSAPIK